MKEDEEIAKRWAVCNKCALPLAYHGGTTTLWRHLLKIHGIEKPKCTVYSLG